jgi:hypothetical protein
MALSALRSARELGALMRTRFDSRGASRYDPGPRRERGRVMPSSDPQCPACRVSMEVGYVLDHTRNRQLPAEWVEGAPERSWLSGVSVKDRDRYEIESWRCPRCGALQEFARKALKLAEGS